MSYLANLDGEKGEVVVVSLNITENDNTKLTKKTLCYDRKLN